MAVKMLAPGIAQTYSVLDGTVFTPGTDGTLDVPAAYVVPLSLQGWTVMADVAIDTTSGRPTNVGPGTPWFDSTLGRPIWRNVANTGWVFSDGTAA